VTGFFVALVFLGLAVLGVCGAYEAERVSRLPRPWAAHGRLARWAHPMRGPVGFVLDGIANSRFLAAVFEKLPVPPILSDITNVIYVSYLVPASALESFVPQGLELQRLGEGGRWALFTFLTYRHGHFGFEFLGPLRRPLPSPIQSNWRIHVRDPRTKQEGVYFITNAISSTFSALCGRLFVEGMPMHVFARAALSREEDGRVTLQLDPGAGSAPDAVASLAPCVAAPLDGPWRECFGSSFRDFLAYCVPQDRAMSTQPWVPRVTRQEIQLGIPLEDCEPLAGEVVSRAAHGIVGDAKPLCFRVADVKFRFAEEAYDPLPLPPA
jgi:hypothetical protein